MSVNPRGHELFNNLNMVQYYSKLKIILPNKNMYKEICEREQ